MEKIILRAPSNGISGYKKLIEKTFAILNKNYELIFIPFNDAAPSELKTLNGLNKDNFHVKELVLSPLCLDFTKSLTNFLPDKDNLIVSTMWESSVVPRFPVEDLNYIANKVLVPSLWNKDVFIASGVKNIVYLPLFVDDELFNLKQKKDLSNFTFCAGACEAVNSGNIHRKNFSVIINAFLKAFKGVKDVELKLKLSASDRNVLGRYLDDRIKFCGDYLTDKGMSDYLAEIDVFVAAAKAEGWGYFQIESLATGRPVISPDYGGIKDFCNNDNSFFVDYEEELGHAGWGKRGGVWANIKEESLIQQMRYCYENKDAIRNNWQKYSDSVLPKFCLKNYENNLLSIL